MADFTSVMTADRVSRIASVILYGFVIVFVLLTYGAVNSTAVLVATMVMYALLFGSVLVVEIPIDVRRAFAVVAAISGLTLGWTFLQFVGLPGAYLANPLWAETSVVLGRDIPGVVTLTPGDGPLGLLKLALPFGVYMTSLVIFDTDERAAFALRMLAICGGLFAALGLFQFLVTPNILLFGDKSFYLDSLTGPFVNRNTAATFFGLTLLMLVGLFWSKARTVRGGIGAWIDGMLQPDRCSEATSALLYGVLVVTTLTALVLTKSRAGLVSTFVALLVFLLLTALLPSRQIRRTDGIGKRRFLKPLFVLLTVIALTGGFALLSGQALFRAQKGGLDDVRFCFLPGMIRAARDVWPQGAGLTSFREVYPAYRDAECGLNGVVDKAHNVYLEGLLSLGPVFVVVVAVAVSCLVWIYTTGMRRRRRFRFAGVLGLAALILVLAHSAFDFSLQIPGLSVYYAALAACLSTLSLRPSAKQ